MEITDKVVNTVLFCLFCERNVVMRGKSEWCDTGDKHPNSKHLNHVNVVVCYGCQSQPGLIASERCLHKADMKEGGAFYRFIQMITTVFGLPLIRALSDLSQTEGAEESWDGRHKTVCGEEIASCDCRIPIEKVARIMEGMIGTYGFMSIIDGKIIVTDVAPDFVSSGKPMGQRFIILPTPFPVHTMIHCSDCGRNVIFSGSYSALRVGPHVAAGKEMTMIVFVQCRRCEAAGKKPGDEINRLAIDGVLGPSDPVQLAKVHFGNAVTVDRYTPRHLGGFAVVARIPFVNRMKYHTTMWSLVANERKMPNADFV